MKLTHKAIAMMCGYDVFPGYYRYGDKYYYWEAPDGAPSDNHMDTEQQAWEACCKDNGLIEEE